MSCRDPPAEGQGHLRHALKVGRGPKVFVPLPEERQREILGPAKYLAVREGATGWDDIPSFKKDPAWGPVGFERPLKDMLGEKAKEYLSGTGGGQPPMPVRQQQPKSPRARVTSMAQRISSPLQRYTQTVSNWNGTVRLRAMVTAWGRKEWDCGISIDRGVLNSPADLWPALNHEMLHALSTGLTLPAYTAFRGWEEGVVEKLQRICGPKALRRIGEQPHVAAYAYNHYVVELERIRLFLKKSDRFYLTLIRTPLADREQAAIMMGSRFTGARQQQWRQLLATALPILRGP